MYTKAQYDSHYTEGYNSGKDSISSINLKTRQFGSMNIQYYKPSNDAVGVYLFMNCTSQYGDYAYCRLKNSNIKDYTGTVSFETAVSSSRYTTASGTAIYCLLFGAKTNIFRNTTFEVYIEGASASCYVYEIYTE